MDANKQLLMFVTGPAGAGKSTATEVPQQFCFEFCRSMDMFGEKIHFYSLP
jgi:cytidylate kinase